MDNKRVYVGFILDKSGSMAKVWKPTVAGFNTQIKAICEGAKEEGLETYVSFSVFDREVHPVYFGKSVNYLNEISEEDHEASGDTSLFDAIGAMVNSMGEISEEADPANSYLLFILSDGQDTHSKKFTREQIGELIKTKQETKKWTFTFMGCDQNLLDVNKHLNIPLGNIANFSKSGSGVAYASSSNARQTKAYMRAKMAGENYSTGFHGQNGMIADYSIEEKLPENTDNLKTFNTTGYAVKSEKPKK